MLRSPSEPSSAGMLVEDTESLTRVIACSRIVTEIAVFVADAETGFLPRNDIC